MRVRRWTPAETKALRQHYPIGGAKRCARLLKARSYGAITMRAHLLGLQRNATMRASRLHFHYNSKIDRITIEGVVYAGETFRRLAGGDFPMDKPIRFHRENGLVRLADSGDAQ
jgi:hypothetical protein